MVQDGLHINDELAIVNGHGIINVLAIVNGHGIINVYGADSNTDLMTVLAITYELILLSIITHGTNRHLMRCHQLPTSLHQNCHAFINSPFNP